MIETDAFLIARMQFVEPDAAVRLLLRNLRAKHDRFALVLPVSALPGSKSNPFDLATRKIILKHHFSWLEVLSIDDHISDEIWSRSLDELAEDHFGNSPVLIYGSQQRFASVYSGSNPVHILPEPSGQDTLPGHFDNDAFSAEDCHNPAFLRGVQSAHAKSYDKVFPTVDMAVLKSVPSRASAGGALHLLMGQKTEVAQWRLPGGFADPTDVSFEHAALRELGEETGALQIENTRYVCSRRLTDWRYRWEKDCVITTLFAADWVGGEPTAADDLAIVSWIPVDQLREMLQNDLIVAVHRPLIEDLLAFIGKEDQH